MCYHNYCCTLISCVQKKCHESCVCVKRKYPNKCVIHELFLHCIIFLTILILNGWLTVVRRLQAVPNFSQEQSIGRARERARKSPRGYTTRGLWTILIEGLTDCGQTTRNLLYPRMYITPQHFVAGTHLFSGMERHCESKVSCPRTQHNDPGQGLNADRSVRSPCSALTIRPSRLPSYVLISYV